MTKALQTRRYNKELKLQKGQNLYKTSLRICRRNWAIQYTNTKYSPVKKNPPLTAHI